MAHRLLAVMYLGQGDQPDFRRCWQSSKKRPRMTAVWSGTRCSEVAAGGLSPEGAGEAASESISPRGRRKGAERRIAEVIGDAAALCRPRRRIRGQGSRKDRSIAGLTEVDRYEHQAIRGAGVQAAVSRLLLLFS